MSPLPNRRRLITSATACAAVLAAGGTLSACKKSQSKITLTLGDQKGGLQSLLELSGEVSNLPYTLQWAQFGASAPLFEAMNAGAIDAGVAGDAPFVFFLASRPAARAIAALNFPSPPPDGAAILVRPNSDIHELADLVGKRVAAVRGSTGHFVVLAALQKAGLPLDAVKFVFLGPSDSLSTLMGGGVDAWGTWEPYLSVGELHYNLRPVPIPPGLLVGLGFIVATNQAIAGKRDALEDFLARFGRARVWAAANPNAYAAGFSKATGLPLDVATRYAHKADYAVAAIDDRRIATVQALADLYTEAKLLPAPVTVDFAFDKDFFKPA